MLAVQEFVKVLFIRQQEQSLHWCRVSMREFMSWKFSINRPNVRQVLECASPLALWAVARSDRAVGGRRTPRRYRANQEFFRLMIRIPQS